MIEKSFIAAICLIIGITVLIFVLVVFRDIVHRIKRNKSQIRIKKYIDYLNGIKHFNLEVFDYIKSNFEIRDLERALDGWFLKNDVDGEAKIRLYEGSGILDFYIEQAHAKTHWSQRSNAVLRLGKTGSQHALKPLFEILNSEEEDDVHVKSSAATGISYIADPNAIPELIEALSYEDSQVTMSISESLLRFGDLAGEELISYLDREDLSHHHLLWVIKTITLLKYNRSYESLVSLLQHPNYEIRIAAIEGLESLKDKRGINLISLIMLHDPSAPVRTAAAKALGSFGDPKAMDPLLRALKDADYTTRSRAIDSLEMMGMQAEAPLLIALRDPSAEIRKSVALALERIGAVHAMIDQIDDPTQNVRNEAFETLKSIAQQDVYETIADNIAHPNFKVRSRVCQILGILENSKLLPEFLKALQDPEWPVQIQAALAISLIPGSKPLEPFLELLESEIEELRWAAAKVIMSLPKDEAVNRLHRFHKLAADKNHSVRMVSIEIIGHLQQEESIPILGDQVSAPDIHLQKACCQSLGQIGSSDCLSYLEKALESPEEDVVEEAVQAIQAIGDVKATSILLNNINNISEKTLIDCFLILYPEDILPLADQLMAISLPKGRMILSKLLSNTKTLNAGSFNRLLLKDSDPIIVKMAVDLAGVTQDKKSLKELLVLFRENNQSISLAALKSIGRIGSLESLDEILMKWKTYLPLIKGEILIALGRNNHEKTEGLSLPYLKSANPQLKGSAIIACLLNMKNSITPGLWTEEMEKMVLTILNEESDLMNQVYKGMKLRGRIYLNGKIRTETERLYFEQYLEDLLNDSEKQTRIRCAKILGKMKIPKSIDYLQQSAQEDPNIYVRAQSLESFVKIAPLEKAVDFLLEGLNDPNKEYIGLALKHLGRIGNSDHNEIIMTLFSQEDPKLFNKAAEALAKINKENFDPIMDLAMGSEDPIIIIGLSQVIKRIDPHRLEKILITLVNHKSAKVRRAAIKEMAQINPEQVQSFLEQSLLDPNPEVRLSSLGVLSKLKKEDKFQRQLKELQEDPIQTIRIKAQRLLS